MNWIIHIFVGVLFVLHVHGVVIANNVTTTSNEINATASHNITNQNLTQYRTNSSNKPDLSYVLQGRIVLANTKENGQTEWGLTHAMAEVACGVISHHEREESNRRHFQHKHHYHYFLKNPTLNQNVKNSNSNQNTNNVFVKHKNPFKGHLLSIGSSAEVSC